MNHIHYRAIFYFNGSLSVDLQAKWNVFALDLCQCYFKTKQVLLSSFQEMDRKKFLEILDVRMQEFLRD